MTECSICEIKFTADPRKLFKHIKSYENNFLHFLHNTTNEVLLTLSHARKAFTCKKAVSVQSFTGLARVSFSRFCFAFGGYSTLAFTAINFICCVVYAYFW